MNPSSVSASGALRRNARCGELLSYRPIYSVLALLLAWEVASRLALINPYFLPPPSMVIQRGYHILLEEQLLQHGRDILAHARLLALCIALAARGRDGADRRRAGFSIR
jgi:ABC-type nitrate/sulfonate/bicarbonate transport system permease component